jgi:hypothetical protein
VTTGQAHWLTGRVQAYAAVWVGLIAVVGYLILSRPALDVTVLRQPGTMFATLPSGDVANFYNVQVFNRTRDDVPFEVAVVEPAGAALLPIGDLSRVAPHALLEGRLLVTLPRASARPDGVPVRIVVRQGGDTLQEIETSFVGPPQTTARSMP